MMSKPIKGEIKNLEFDCNQSFEKIFKAAFAAKNYATALKAKELQVKYFSRQNYEDHLMDYLMGLNARQLEKLIDDLQKRLTMPIAELSRR